MRLIYTDYLNKEKHDCSLRPFSLALPENIYGHDYIVGDLHGCFDELQNLLEQVGFNESCDRLICTGDLVHRGNKSAECLSLLNNDWFFSVLGNHDSRLMIKDSTDYQERQRYLNKLDTLPYVIHIEGEKEFFVVHAEIQYDLLFYGILPPEPFSSGDDVMLSGKYPKSIEKALKKALDILPSMFTEAEMNYHPLFKSLIWGRDMIRKVKAGQAPTDGYEVFNDGFINQKFNIFCGHNTVQKVCRIGHQIFLDTGAGYAYCSKHHQHTENSWCLSMVQAKTGRILQSKRLYDLGV